MSGFAMESNQREPAIKRPVVVTREARLSSRSTLTLSVPARPEALGIVRLVLMSCGAAAGRDLDEIFARSRDVASAFTSVLVNEPDAACVVIRTEMDSPGVDLMSVRGTDR